MNNRKDCILVLNYGQWDSLKRGVHHYCTIFSNRYLVLYIHSPSQGIINSYDEDIKNRLSFCLREKSNNIYELFWPKWCREYYRYKIPEILLKYLRIYFIKKALKKMGVKKIRFIYAVQPLMFKYLDKFKSEIKIYHVFDEYSYYNGSENKNISSIEKSYIPKFNALFCVTEKLLDQKKKLNTNSYYLPNGVDIDLFFKNPDSNFEVDKFFSELGRPFLGYVGNISGKVDLELIRFLAQNRSEWIFVFIGPKNLNEEDSNSFDFLCSLENFFYLGFKPPEALPGWMKKFDVGLMPYRLKGHMQWGCPLKLYEYMASGIPSVSADIGAVQAKEGVVYVARNKEEWLELIEISIDESRDPELINRRRMIASNNSWDHRVNDFLKIIKRLD